MIRLGKPVQILQWGEGTNTTNQRWQEIGKGRFASKPKTVQGVTSILIEVDGSINKLHDKNSDVKLMQQSEGMVAHSTKWGEVAMGTLKGVSNESGRTIATIEVHAATKYSN